MINTMTTYVLGAKNIILARSDQPLDVVADRVEALLSNARADKESSGMVRITDQSGRLWQVPWHRILYVTHRSA